MSRNQPPPPPYGPPPPQRYVATTKHRGLSGKAHSGHFLATVFTCGLWLPVWGCIWLFRLFVRRKQKTVYRA